MQDILEIIKTRRSIRKFNDAPIPQETLEAILQSGRCAPTGGNCQSVHFTVITNPQVLETLRTLVKSAFAAMEYREDLYASLKNSIRLSQRGDYVYDYNAPVLVVVSNVRGYGNAVADSACALQNMMLSATALGVGSCWINQLHWLDEDSAIRQYLAAFGISDAETICGSLALGNFNGTFSSRERTGMQVDWIR